MFLFYCLFSFCCFSLLVWKNCPFSLASVRRLQQLVNVCCPCGEEQGGSTLLLHVSIPHGKGMDRRYCINQIENTLTEEATGSISVSHQVKTQLI